MTRRSLVWAGGILIAVAAGLGGYVAGVGLEEGDRLASVIAAITGLAGLGAALYGLKRPPAGAAPTGSAPEAVAAESAASMPRPSSDLPQPPAEGRSYGGDHVEIHGTFAEIGEKVEKPATRSSPPSTSAGCARRRPYVRPISSGRQRHRKKN